MMEFALQYAGRGWSLVPYRTGKVLGFRGRITDNATRDPSVIETWRRMEAVGLACGFHASPDVCDIDDARACPLDVDALLQATLAARTPSGGIHLFYRDASLRSRSFPWGEWRSCGLAVVLPPAPGRAWVNSLPIVDAPPELIELVRRPDVNDPPTSFLGPLMADASGELPKPLYCKVIRLVPLSAQVTRHHQRRVIGILNIALQRRKRRNDGINIAGFCLRELIDEGIVSPAAAEELLFDVASLCGYVEKDGADAAWATIRSGLGE
jgi:hypothetical protein